MCSIGIKAKVYNIGIRQIWGGQVEERHCNAMFYSILMDVETNCDIENEWVFFEELIKRGTRFVSNMVKRTIFLIKGAERCFFESSKCSENTSIS